MIGYNKPLTVTVIGGGNSAHVLIPFLSSSGNSVNLLTRRPKKWSKEITTKYQLPSGITEEVFQGKLDIISDLPEDVIPQADIIIHCMPVSKYRSSLHNIAPYISKNRDVFIGFIYGQGGVNWMIREIRQSFDLTNLVYFSFGLIPWICRTVEYGKEGVIYGPEMHEINTVAVYPKDRFDWLNDVFLRNICERWFGKGSFCLADNFLSLTLSVDNQIIHPSRCFGLFLRYEGKWNSRDEIPLFYGDYDDLSADLLEKLDYDYSLVRDAIRARYPNLAFTYMLDYLALEHLSYGSHSTDILESLEKSSSLSSIGTPTIKSDKGEWVLDKNSRFFTDDIHYGLCIAKWFAEQLNLNVTTIDRILNWVQILRNESIINKGKLLLESQSLMAKFASGIPSVYGFKSIDLIINVDEEDG